MVKDTVVMCGGDIGFLADIFSIVISRSVIIPGGPKQLRCLRPQVISGFRHPAVRAESVVIVYRDIDFRS